MAAVFVDTSAFLPLVDRDDRDHGRIVAAVEALADEGAALVTSNYILVECGALIRRRMGVAAFRALGEAVDRAVDVLVVDEETHRRAWAAAAEGTARGPGLVDCSSFVLMREAGIGTALTLDRHFAREGFRILP
jgi:hypothetical protein